MCVEKGWCSRGEGVARGVCSSIHEEAGLLCGRESDVFSRKKNTPLLAHLLDDPSYVGSVLTVVSRFVE